MKFLAIALFTVALSSVSPWLNDFEEAKKIALQKHQLILVNFSGSDWCGPCIRLHKEVFDTEAFQKLATDQLVLLNADFPRLKKNQLPGPQQQQNEKLADLYNSAGNFPSTVLINAAGKVLKVWDGFPKQGAAGFIEELNKAMHANQQ
jgi:thioredoxin-related protein